MIDRIGRIQGVQSGISPEVPAAAKAGGDTFGAVFQRELERTQSRQVAFSKHAMARAEERGIEMTDDLMSQLAHSVGKAQEKGAKNILVLDAGRAFIVNVPQSKVITAISQDEMRDNVFTNIDGAVLLR